MIQIPQWLQRCHLAPGGREPTQAPGPGPRNPTGPTRGMRPSLRPKEATWSCAMSASHTPCGPRWQVRSWVSACACNDRPQHSYSPKAMISSTEIVQFSDHKNCQLYTSFCRCKASGPARCAAGHQHRLLFIFQSSGMQRHCCRTAALAFSSTEETAAPLHVEVSDCNVVACAQCCRT